MSMLHDNYKRPKYCATSSFQFRKKIIEQTDAECQVKIGISKICQSHKVMVLNNLEELLSHPVSNSRATHLLPRVETKRYRTNALLQKCVILMLKVHLTEISAQESFDCFRKHKLKFTN